MPPRSRRRAATRGSRGAPSWPASLVDLNVLLDAGTKLRVLAEQLAKQALIQRQQARPARRPGRWPCAGPPDTAKARRRSLRCAGTGCCARPSAAALKGAQPALLDDEERPAGVALADDKLSRFELDGVEAREHRRDRRLRQAREGRVNAQEVRQAPRSRLQRERFADRRVDSGRAPRRRQTSRRWHRTSLAARTLAVRGVPSSSPASPKDSPSCRTLSETSWPSSPSYEHAGEPDVRT